MRVQTQGHVEMEHVYFFINVDMNLYTILINAINSPLTSFHNLSSTHAVGITTPINILMKSLKMTIWSYILQMNKNSVALNIIESYFCTRLQLILKQWAMHVKL